MKPVKFKLNGEDHSLYYDWNVICDFEEKFDISAPYAMTGKRLGFSTIRNLFWAGMLHENPDLDVRELGKTLQESVQSKEHSMNSLGEIMTKAVSDSGVLDIDVSDKKKD